MQRLSVIGIIASVVVFAAPAFSADHPAVAEWNRYCLSTHGDLAKGIALADADGWQKALTPAMDEYYPGQARKKIDSLGLHLLAFSQFKRALPQRDDLHMMQCMVLVPSHESAVQALTSLLGGGPLYWKNGLANWLLVETQSGFSIPSESELEAVKQAASEGRVFLVKAALTSEGAAIILEAPKPLAKP
jgi:hypothetical protein